MMSLISVLVLISLLFTSAYAYESVEEETVIFETEYSELEQLVQLRSKEENELLALGYSSEEAAAIHNLDIEGAVMERASLSVEQLAALGHTKEEIALLKAYDGESIDENSPVLAASPVCSGTMAKANIVSDRAVIQFTYLFTWTACPLIQQDDKVAVIWRAVNDDGVVSCTPTSLSGYVKYYSDTTGSYLYTVYKTPASDGDFDGRQFSYDVSVPHDDPVEADWAWAKSGSMTIQLEPLANVSSPSGNVQISTVEAYAAVGHQSIAGVFNIGVSGSSAGVSLSLSFTPTSKVVKVGIAHYIIPMNGSITPAL